MSVNVEFLICCIEEYKVKHHIAGGEAYELFHRYGIDDYIVRHYDALHTSGVEYAVEEVEQMVDEPSARI